MKLSKNIGLLGFAFFMQFSMLAYDYPTGISDYHNSWTRGHYPDRIDDFRNNPLPRKGIVFIGDSITEMGGDWGARFDIPVDRGIPVYNRGIKGDVTDGVLLRLDEVIQSSPRAVFILIGVNDLFSYHDYFVEGEALDPSNKKPVPNPDVYIADNIKKIANQIKTGSPDTEIYVRTLLPTRNKGSFTEGRVNTYIPALNALIKENAANLYTVIDLHAEFVDSEGYLKYDLTVDGCHLSSDGYNAWVAFERPYLLDVFEKNYPSEPSPYHDSWTSGHYRDERIIDFFNNPLEKDEIVFLGDGLIEYGGDWSERHGITVRNRGIDGDVTDGVLRRLDEVINSTPKAVFIQVGAMDLYSYNDLTVEGGAPDPEDQLLIPNLEFIANNIAEIANKIRTGSPGTKIYVHTVLPGRYEYDRINTYVSILNALIKANAANLYTVIDLYAEFADEWGYLKREFTDGGCHLNETGYAAWVAFENPIVLSAALATQHTVTFVEGTNGSRTGGGELVQAVADGGAAVAPEITASVGWSFTGWDIAFDNVTSDITVTAQYSVQVTHTVTFVEGANGSRTGGGELVQTVNDGGLAVAPEITASTGWSFIGWDKTFNNVTSDLTVTANYAINSYALTYTAGQNGSILGTSPQVVSHGDNGETVTAVANTGYYFVQWSDGVTSASRKDSNITSNISVTALFAADGQSNQLLAHWTFDDGTGNIAVDETGNNYDGILTGGTTWTQGKIGGSLDLDGNSAYMTTGMNENLENWTIACWVRSPLAPQASSASGPMNREKNFQINWNHPSSSYRGAAALEVNGAWYSASFGDLGANRWYHLAATYDGETLKAYKDGVLITENDAMSGAPGSETVELTLGKHPLAENYFSGSIDDARVYNYALTDVDIALLAYTNTSNQLMAHYQFEEGTGNAAADSSVNAYNATLNGNASWVTGQIGNNAVFMDGVNSYVSTNMTEDLENWTIACWVRSPLAPQSASPSGPINREKNFQINWNHPSSSYRGAAALEVGGSWYAASFGELEANTWYHLTATYDGESLKAYRDGILITENDSMSGAPSAETLPMTIGKHPLAENYFEGSVDDARVYNYALTDVDIALLAGTGTGINITDQLITHYRFEEGAGTAANDSSAYGYNATLNGNTSWDEGRVGNSAVFMDGFNGYVSTNMTENLENWSVSCWVKSPLAPQEASASGPINREKNFQINWNHPNSSYRGAAALEVGGSWYAASFGELEGNTWYHLVATYDGEVLRTYRDGVLITENDAMSGAPSAETAPMTIGKHPLAEHYFEGTVDDIRVYNYPISENTVIDLFNN